MALEKKRAAKQLELPTLIFGSVEVHRLQRELELLEEFLTQAAIREPGKQPPLPKTSRLLEGLAGNNGYNLLQATDRKHIAAFLQDILTNAPVVHISFAADPSSTFTAKIVAWFRTTIHPHMLIQLGLQPNIAAGCVVRTSNKSFDFSLRERFLAKHELLLEAIEGKAGV